MRHLAEHALNDRSHQRPLRDQSALLFRLIRIDVHPSIHQDTFTKHEGLS